MVCVTVTQRICWRQVRIFVTFRNYWGTRAAGQRRFTLMSQKKVFRRFAPRLMIYDNLCASKLQLRYPIIPISSKYAYLQYPYKRVSTNLTTNTYETINYNTTFNLHINYCLSSKESIEKFLRGKIFIQGRYLHAGL